MKENVIDVLMFLFDNYLGLEEGDVADEATLAYELEEAGFPQQEITKAFDWLGELADENNMTPEFIQPPSASMRIYAEEEQIKLDVSCRGFLQYLEWAGLVDPMAREIIIDRAMAIDADTLGLELFKKIVSLVLVNKEPETYAYGSLEDLLEDTSKESHH